MADRNKAFSLRAGLGNAIIGSYNDATTDREEGKTQNVPLNRRLVMRNVYSVTEVDDWLEQEEV